MKGTSCDMITSKHCVRMGQTWRNNASYIQKIVYKDYEGKTLRTRSTG